MEIEVGNLLPASYCNYTPSGIVQWVYPPSRHIKYAFVMCRKLEWIT